MHTINNTVVVPLPVMQHCTVADGIVYSFSFNFMWYWGNHPDETARL
jgi:hypothetical protein